MLGRVLLIISVTLAVAVLAASGMSRLGATGVRPVAPAPVRLDPAGNGGAPTGLPTPDPLAVAPSPERFEPPSTTVATTTVESSSPPPPAPATATTSPPSSAPARPLDRDDGAVHDDAVHDDAVHDGAVDDGADDDDGDDDDADDDGGDAD